jgi:hypothetical protein
VTSHIGGSQTEAPSCCNETCDIAIRDIPTSPEPSISKDMCQEILRSQSSVNQSFRRQETLAIWNHDPRYPDGRVVWAIVGDSGRQVA